MRQGTTDTTRAHPGLGPTILSLFALGLLLALVLAPVASARSVRRPAYAPLAPARGHATAAERRGATAHAAVIGGSIAAHGTFPSLAFVYYELNSEEAELCTGTVVAPNLILTAAHCAENLETGVHDTASQYIVVTGNVDWAAQEDERQLSYVSKVVVDPSFDADDLTNDAALLVLKADTPTRAPLMSLWTPEDVGSLESSGTLKANTPATIAGWGNTEQNQSEEKITTELQWASTIVQESSLCNTEAPVFYQQYELCALDPPGDRTGPCHGDSGGPLLVEGSSGPVEVGITSHGYEHEHENCSTRLPSVFTRTDTLTAWVKEWSEAVKPGTEPSQAEPEPLIQTPPVPSPTPVAPTPIVESPAPTTPVPAVPATTTPATATNSLPLEGIYRGSTSQSTDSFALTLGAGGDRVSAVSATVSYACSSGRTLKASITAIPAASQGIIGSDGEFTISLSQGTTHATIAGTVDPSDEAIAGTLTATRKTSPYGRCRATRVVWMTHRESTLAAAAIAKPGVYSGTTARRGRISLTVAPEGRTLTGIRLTAVYRCRHGSRRLTSSLLATGTSEALEAPGTFALKLVHGSALASVAGALELSPGSAFGTLEASTSTRRYGRCETGPLSFSARA